MVGSASEGHVEVWTYYTHQIGSHDDYGTHQEAEERETAGPKVKMIQVVENQWERLEPGVQNGVDQAKVHVRAEQDRLGEA